MTHTHTYPNPPNILTLTLPDHIGNYDVLQVWQCPCGWEYDIASTTIHGKPLLSYNEAQAAYQAEQRSKRTRTILKSLRGGKEK